eukprot:g8218.t1
MFGSKGAFFASIKALVEIYEKANNTNAKYYTTQKIVLEGGQDKLHGNPISPIYWEINKIMIEKKFEPPFPLGEKLPYGTYTTDDLDKFVRHIYKNFSEVAISELKKQLETSKQANEKLTQDNVKLKEEKDSVKTRLETSKQTNEKLTQDNVKLKEEKDSVKTRLETSKQANEKLTQDNVKLKEEKDSLSMIVLFVLKIILNCRLEECFRIFAAADSPKPKVV